MTPIWHPFNQLRGFAPIGQVIHARDAWLHLDDGRRLFDGISSWWVNLHGHGHPVLAAAITRQAAAFDQVILADFSHAPAADLTRHLVPWLPKGLTRVFLSDDGSTSVEVAIKMAWQAQRRDGPQRHLLVAFDGSYHGDTLGAMAVGARDSFAAPFHGLLVDVVFLPWNDPEAVRTWFAAHGERVVAAIVEPMIQCAGGMRMCSPAFLQAVAAAAHGSGALWIADEVAVGFGRTGRMWGCDHAGVQPDLLCMSKGITGGTLPLGATACTEAIYASFLGDDKRTAFLHAHSYTGNPLACAAAVANLGVMHSEGTIARFARMEQVYHDHIPRMAAALPDCHGFRALGSVFAFDAPGEGYHAPIGRIIQREAVRRELYVRPLGHVVYLMPPACTTPDLLADMLDRLTEATKAALA